MNNGTPYQSISRAFDGLVPTHRQAFRKAISAMTELDADFHDSLARVMDVVGSPQFEAVERNNPQLKTNIDSWQNEVTNSVVHFRERLAFLLQDLKYISSPLQSDPLLKSRLDAACDSMNPVGENDIATKYTAQQVENMFDDKLGVLYPGYRPQRSVAAFPAQPAIVPQPRSLTPPITIRNAVYDNPAQIRDPPQAYRIDQHGNKVYMDTGGLGTQKSVYNPPAQNPYTNPSPPVVLPHTPSGPTIVNQPTQYREIRVINNDPLLNNQTMLDSDTLLMINEAKRDFGNPTLEIIPVQAQPTKIDVAKDGREAIYGGDSIGMIQKRDGWIIDEGILFDNKTCTLKHLPNGDVLVNNFSNWDLVLLDQFLNEKGKLRGGYSGEPNNFRQIQTRNSEDDNSILWLSHPDHLSIVRTNNLSSNEIRNFWKFNGIRVNPIACAISPSGKRLVGISKLDNSHILHFYEGSDQVVMYKQEDIHPRCTEWESLEISYDQDMFLLGGSDGRGTAYVIALSLNDEANLVAERTLPNLRSATSLRRHNQGDVYFVGGYRTIGILFYNKRQLHILRDVSISIEGFVRDLSFNTGSQELYGVTGTDKAFVVNFSNEATRPIKSVNRPVVSPRQRRRLGDTLNRSPSQNNLFRQADSLATSTRNTVQTRIGAEPRYLAQFNEFSIRQLKLPNSSPS